MELNSLMKPELKREIRVLMKKYNMMGISRMNKRELCRLLTAMRKLDETYQSTTFIYKEMRGRDVVKPLIPVCDVEVEGGSIILPLPPDPRPRGGKNPEERPYTILDVTNRVVTFKD
jgi:hypothetical protein